MSKVTVADVLMEAADLSLIVVPVGEHSAQGQHMRLMIRDPTGRKDLAGPLYTREALTWLQGFRAGANGSA